MLLLVLHRMVLALGAVEVSNNSIDSHFNKVD
jgi:hypothetical protein